MSEEPAGRVSQGYQFFMLVLCLYALAALTAQAALQLSPATRVILDYADNIVCAVFFADFLISLIRAPNRWKYFRTWGWLDFLSSIPMLDFVRWGRLARVVRVFRVLRGFRATKLLAGMVMRHRAENTFLATSLVALLLVVFSSVAVLHFETSPNSNIKTPDDAIWWAFATITTVGYGDRYPVTGEGRILATILMGAGVGLFGMFSGFLAAWFLGSREKEPEKDGLAAVREELASLREVVQRLADRRSDKILQSEGGGEPGPPA